jgi:hypothetical protein
MNRAGNSFNISKPNNLYKQTFVIETVTACRVVDARRVETPISMKQ